MLVLRSALGKPFEMRCLLPVCSLPSQEVHRVLPISGVGEAEWMPRWVDQYDPGVTRLFNRLVCAQVDEVPRSGCNIVDSQIEMDLHAAPFARPGRRNVVLDSTKPYYRLRALNHRGIFNQVYPLPAHKFRPESRNWCWI